MHSRIQFGLAAVLYLASILTGPVSAAELTGTHNDWKTYKHGAGKDQMCFAVTPAQEQQPSGGDRKTPHAYVTTWPKQGVKAEISILLGFDLKPDSDVTVDVSGASFKLFADGDRGFVGEPGDEEKLLAAMKRGTRMTVEAISDKGTKSRDVFSLSGVTASMQEITAGCS